jgi:hypothetical protein
MTKSHLRIGGSPASSYPLEIRGFASHPCEWFALGT